MRSQRLIYLALTAASIPLATTAALSHNHKSAAKPSGNIVAGVSSSKDHKTLVAAVKAAGLVDTLASGGPFTVFAPTDSAFGKLPSGTLETLLKPENKATLSSILTYHVVPGKVTAKSLIDQIGAGGGQTELTTVQGGKLIASLAGGKVVLRDQTGGTATVTVPDMMHANGIIHVTDSVSLPG